ncbi:hypothetical protein HPP92_015684 [Vanilla planifolia]|uniref:Uncharacterized protein n=1 Tax=Vanilla planifolia TaxID=51239 RepID=A0A835UTX0_VANPL|nr:hypothetical protein HPP92_015684 [Vanilla planifolia]
MRLLFPIAASFPSKLQECCPSLSSLSAQVELQSQPIYSGVPSTGSFFSSLTELLLSFTVFLIDLFLFSLSFSAEHHTIHIISPVHSLRRSRQVASGRRCHLRVQVIVVIVVVTLASAHSSSHRFEEGQSVDFHFDFGDVGRNRRDLRHYIAKGKGRAVIFGGGREKGGVGEEWRTGVHKFVQRGWWGPRQVGWLMLDDGDTHCTTCPEDAPTLF